MNLKDSLNRYYYDCVISDLRQLRLSGTDELSYNSVLYLDIIIYQRETGICTVSTLSKALHITTSAATIKINELHRQGFVTKTRSESDRRVIHLNVTPAVAEALGTYDGPFQRAIRAVEQAFSPQQLQTFCTILEAFREEYCKEI